ncbi:hypothetical protein SHKM778_39750 [Streptomyces sp. KM77-8]|uniref:Uncharacterized protein n=1 Tax=Streptomyces haneummycinicus TaxID=3074435 RepID=A0AAT9HKC5_9ACTN
MAGGGFEGGTGIREVHGTVAAGHARGAGVGVPAGLEVGDAEQHALRYVVLGGRGGERLLEVGGRGWGAVGGGAQ